MPKPKFVKPLLIGVACTIPVGLVVGLSVNWDNTQFISAVGSSGVKPFIEKFGKQYHIDYSNFDVNVESGGTTFAVSQLAQGFTNLGNASNNPYPNIHSEGYDALWANKKTLTLGWEGLAIVYKLPNGLSEDAAKKFEIVISKDNILALYSIFSAIHELKNDTWKDDMQYLWYYAPKSIQDQITRKEDRDLLQQTPIVPYLRSGGNTGANSSIAFTCYSNLCNFKDDLTEAQRKAFMGGQYGDDNLWFETDESNTRAWQSFTNNNLPASMVYLTTSFLAVEGNRQSMIEHNCKVAQYLDKNGSEPTKLEIDSAEHWKESLERICQWGQYNWYRPINTMIDVNLEKARDFVYWMYFGDSQVAAPTEFSEFYLNTVKSLGTKPLSINQLETMMAGSGTYKERLFNVGASDVELAESRTGEFKEVYGAQDYETTK